MTSDRSEEHCFYNINGKTSNHDRKDENGTVKRMQSDFLVVLEDK